MGDFNPGEWPAGAAPLQSLTAASRWLGLLVALVGGVHIVAWLTGALAPLGATSVTLKANAALCLLLLGAALTLPRYPESRGKTRHFAAALVIPALVIAALTLLENLFGWNFHIDQVLAHEAPGALGVTSPNRMGTPMAVGVLLAGLALLEMWRRTPRGAVVGQRLALGVTLLGLLSTIGYLYKAPSLYGLAGVTAIALPSALALLVVGTALLLTLPHAGMMRQVTAPDPGGRLVRRLLVPVVLVPLVAGWLHVALERAGWIEGGLGMSLLVFVFILIFSTQLYAAGRQVSRASAAMAEMQKEQARLHERAFTERARLEAVFHQLPAGVAIAAAPSGDIVYTNEYADRVLGRTRGAQGEGAAHRLEPRYPDGRAMTHAEMPMVRALRGETVSSQMLRLPREGGWVDLSVSAAPLRDAGGNVSQAVLTFEDVTERRRVEEALTRSEAQVRAVIENLKEGLVVASLDGRLTHCNQAALTMYGFERMEDFSEPMSEWARIFELSTLDGTVLPPHEWPLPRLLRGEAVSDWELGVRRLQRAWERIHSYRGTLVRDAAGQPMMAVITVSDVTERKHAEERLRRSEALFRSMFESAAAGMALVHLPTGRFLRVNHELALVTGYTQQELLEGMSIVDLVPPEEREAAAAGLSSVQAAEPGEGYFVERRHLRKDGQVIHVELHGSTVHDGADLSSVGMFVLLDATERKRAESELAAAKQAADQARAQAEEASNAKDHFLSVLSHELRTPLSPVLTGVSLIERETGVSERGRSILEVIRRNVELESRLIDDLLDLTRIARGKVELDRRRVDICSVIDRAVEVCHADLEGRRLHFGVAYGARPYVIDADAARLQQVFWNLLKNAIKFTPKGGCVGVRCRPEQGEVVVEISDSGIGIDPEALTTIFDAFAQAERSITRQFGGLGLGLAISKALVELHGGRIEARSEGRNKGAVFIVRIPLADVLPASGAIPPASEAGERAGRRALRVLLVEDHGDTAEMMSTLITLAGHSVETAADVGSALEALAERQFDLLVSDLGLPDRSGLELMSEVRARGLPIRGIALSGYGQEHDVQQSRAAGFSAHLVKPAEPEVLLETIDRVARA